MRYLTPQQAAKNLQLPRKEIIRLVNERRIRGAFSLVDSRGVTVYRIPETLEFVEPARPTRTPESILSDFTRSYQKRKENSNADATKL